MLADDSADDVHGIDTVGRCGALDLRAQRHCRSSEANRPPRGISFRTSPRRPWCVLSTRPGRRAARRSGCREAPSVVAAAKDALPAKREKGEKSPPEKSPSKNQSGHPPHPRVAWPSILPRKLGMHLPESRKRRGARLFRCARKQPGGFHLATPEAQSERPAEPPSRKRRPSPASALTG